MVLINSRSQFRRHVSNSSTPSPRRSTLYNHKSGQTQSPTDLLYFSELALLLAVSLATDFDDKSFFSSKCRESRDKSTGYKSN